MSSQTTSKDRSLAHARNTSVAARLGAPNPQGKGLVGFLLDWDYSSPQAVVAKRPARLLADYFTSLLVLTSSFKFKPVFNKDYYLYREDDDWRLSLISPDEWDSDEKRRSFVGTCVLPASIRGPPALLPATVCGGTQPLDPQLDDERRTARC